MRNWQPTIGGSCCTCMSQCCTSLVSQLKAMSCTTLSVQQLTVCDGTQVTLATPTGSRMHITLVVSIQLLALPSLHTARSCEKTQQVVSARSEMWQPPERCNGMRKPYAEKTRKQQPFATFRSLVAENLEGIVLKLSGTEQVRCASGCHR